ncbi:hypothetical protein QA584_22455 [Anaerocolumna sp. AGMB13025]|uniref:hypothetical protein n=1 Tax=Anaerocolumna sp. AGMB13025 TaxID=3039116 RepID=UPI00241CB732|nr:hypothetical protein [Anaerocolumna sp. AGMB13025]WFR56350.1 hypothetical protein QA584_22455 [Anaerocolumna sp. AGMB13025]
MFDNSYSYGFSSGNKQNGILYSKLETSVIASFNPAGKIKPLYFQYKDFYGDNTNIKIERVLSSKEETIDTLPVITYSCQANVQSRTLQCKLRYHISEHYWEILY